MKHRECTEEGDGDMILAHDGAHDVSVIDWGPVLKIPELECVISSDLSCQKTAVVAVCDGKKPCAERPGRR